ncbi:phytochrome-interacting ankyrin-repeat protein 2 isoform X2 [Gossypium hirsutum]|uniref:Phytochrome-interacting ankyrin-repeat protein 2 isoform X2 n=1 Tax=Gossypium hirsutum TaxID=3635 RepID=A0ABM3AHL6_GOSHI|nr:phytochrome-interacting ankyrin-repeat protein 2 isoform X2 [Gossypium hirsutum]
MIEVGQCSTSEPVKVKQLLNEGVDVNVAAWGPKSQGVTPLHLAAEGGHLEVMDELLERGANIDARTKGACGLTSNYPKRKNKMASSLVSAYAQHCGSIVFLSRVCTWTPLHTAAKERKREAVKFLIENGAFLPDDINDCRFNPPLHYCPGLEWAYEEMKRLQRDGSSSAGETSYSSEN